ncbi:WecB/TagA/CpsF family glycosyltransferase [Actinoalloteichus sp. GBA129-24]|uniref:WecB/TagA/CpsF family glycosyltransferase n=1 Tax=Actinoalloteichus sp. GBA129-24 TaxID=1612551 RepID=UPI0009506531|nr:WecB/TagA/CpsF family glycosyltransferase [Actinoalloteichus sp. GBA129-24]APU23827.1 exopolysaccharide biosynthesis protein, WecB/TagA/CpsF family [Actinoalloteichus sp. GBA129-24]
MPSDIPTAPILGIPVARLTLDQARDEVGRLLDQPGPALLCYVNAHSANLAATEPAYHRVLRDADLVLNDGSGMAMAARWHGTPFPTNLNGTDFTPEVLRLAADRELSVFFLGGRDEVGVLAAARLADRIPGLRSAGSLPGYLSAADGPAVAARIKASGAGVLVVGMGNPRQELWLARHLPATGVRLGVAVGAFLDFASGRTSRAPSWMRRTGVEWLFRLCREPRRLFRRYVLGNPLFLVRVARERVRSARRPQDSLAPAREPMAPAPTHHVDVVRRTDERPVDPRSGRLPHAASGDGRREDL